MSTKETRVYRCAGEEYGIQDFWWKVYTGFSMHIRIESAGIERFRLTLNRQLTVNCENVLPEQTWNDRCRPINKLPRSATFSRKAAYFLSRPWTMINGCSVSHLNFLSCPKRKMCTLTSYHASSIDPIATFQLTNSSNPNPADNRFVYSSKIDHLYEFPIINVFTSRMEDHEFRLSLSVDTFMGFFLSVYGLI